MASFCRQLNTSVVSQLRDTAAGLYSAAIENIAGVKKLVGGSELLGGPIPCCLIGSSF